MGDECIKLVFSATIKVIICLTLYYRTYTKIECYNEYYDLSSKFNNDQFPIILVPSLLLKNFFFEYLKIIPRYHII